MSCKSCAERRRRALEAARQRDVRGLARNLAYGAAEMAGLKDKLTDDAIEAGKENEDE